MSPRFNRDGGEGFRPWKRDEDRNNDRSQDGDGEGGFRSRGGFGGDRGFDRRPPWKRDRDEGGEGGFRPRGGFGGDRGFDRRPPWKRDRDEGGEGGFRPRGGFGGDRGFDRRPPWKRDRDEGGFGGRSFDRRPPWKRDRDEGFKDFGKPAWRKDEDDTSVDVEETEEQAVEAAPEKPVRKHTPAVPEGELIYGRQPVREMLRAGRRIVNTLVLADGVKDTEEVVEVEAIANERGVTIERRDRETLDAWVNNANHQGVLAVCADYPYAEFDEIIDAFLKKEGNGLLVLLDHVVDPQNLGSLIRTSEVAGAAGVIIPTDRAVGVTPAVVRASAGASEHLPIACVASLPDAILKLKEAKNEAGEPIFVNVVGLEGAADSVAYTEIDFKGKVALVVGSEGLGLGKLVKERCDTLAKLPMAGHVTSLNAGVAGAVAIYEVIRQQA